MGLPLDFLTRSKTVHGLRQDFIDQIHRWLGQLQSGELEREWAWYGVPVENRTVLDVGGGIGHWLVALLPTKPRILVCGDADARFAGVWQALQAEVPEWRTIRFTLFDAGALPFPEESFDVVLCNNVLNYVGNDDLALDELSRVVREEGYLLLRLMGIGEALHRILVGGGWRSKFLGGFSLLVSSPLYHLTGRKIKRDTFQLYGRVRRRLKGRGSVVVKTVTRRYLGIPVGHSLVIQKRARRPGTAVGA